MAVYDSRWVWTKVNPNTEGASGKISDLFRNEGVPERGLFQIEPPTPAATLMAREVIQNSWDAAQELRRDMPEIAPFELDFNFDSVSGAEKRHFVDALSLEALASHADLVAPGDDERKKLGLGTDDCLKNLDSSDAISYCEIIERGASGMYGPWEGARSRMYLAMLAVGYQDKFDGSGGTFGYGKAGLIRASHTRTIVAYTCFKEREDDPRVTRRLLGVTYWGRHTHDGEDFNGFARYGQLTSELHVEPFVNDSADAIAESLGMELRDPSDPLQLGTTFIVVDPSVEADDLRVAIERNWWPALLDNKFTVVVRDPTGDECPCRPKRNPSLASFIEAYEAASSGVASETPTAKVVDLGQYAPHGGARVGLGVVSLVADPAGWSFPDDSPEEQRSLVALTRSPRMVVEYHLPGRDISRRVPFVRGVFIASDDVNIALSKTEPKAHDKWDTTESDDVDTIDTKIAGTILDRIRQQVRRFQEELRPPPDQTGVVRLQRLDEKLKKLRNQEGTKPPPPPPGERPFGFTTNMIRTWSSAGLVLEGTVNVRLSSEYTISSGRSAAPSQVEFSLALDEDGRRGEEVELTVRPPSGFSRHANGHRVRFEGIVTEEGVEFEVVSAPYRDDWTGDFVIDGELLQDSSVGTVTP